MNNDCSEALEAPYFSDSIDSDIEVELYSQLHHEPNFGDFVQETEKTVVSSTFCNDAIRKVREENVVLSEGDNKRQFISIALERRVGSRKRLLHNEHVSYSNSKRQSYPYEKRKCRKSGAFFNDMSNSWFENQGTDVKEYYQKKELTPELIDLSESPQKLKHFLNENKTGCDKKPFIHKIRKEEIEHVRQSPSGSAKQKKNRKQQEVITVIDSDEVHDIIISSDSDSTIDVLSSSDEAIVNEEISTDIHLNINGLQNSSLHDFDLDEELKRMPGDPGLWRINEKDRFPSAYKKSFQYQQDSRLQKITCLNCRERGHLSRNCMKPRRLVVCYLCGIEGHEGANCPHPACIKCMTLGHRVDSCNWKDKFMNQKCLVCNMKGHLADECPDKWRKYHMTVSADSDIVSSKPFSVSEEYYCYNCGSFGHLGHDCRKRRMNNYVHPHVPWVVNYSETLHNTGVPNTSYEQSKRDRELYHRNLYAKKQKLSVSANRKHLKVIFSRGVKKTVLKRGGWKMLKNKFIKNRKQRKSKESLNKSYFQNGQIYYPRTVGIQGKVMKMKIFRNKKRKNMTVSELSAF